VAPPAPVPPSRSARSPNGPSQRSRPPRSNQDDQQNGGRLTDHDSQIFDNCSGMPIW
jgi:hypothetical protein